MIRGLDPESFTFLSLALGVTALRVWARVRQVGWRFTADDYWMILACALYVAESLAAYFVIAWAAGLTNSYMTPEERGALDPSSREYQQRVLGSKIQVVGWELYTAVLWCAKFSLAHFYYRMSTGLPLAKRRLIVSYAVLGTVYVIPAIIVAFGCSPIERHWQIDPDPGNVCQPTLSRLIVITVVVTDVATDAFLMTIPLPIIWRLQHVSRCRKVGLMMLFSAGVFVIMSGIIRAVTILTDDTSGQGAITSSKWAVRQTFVSIVIANLPVVQPLLVLGATYIGTASIFTRLLSTFSGESFCRRQQDQGGGEQGHNSYLPSHERGSRNQRNGGRKTSDMQKTMAAEAADSAGKRRLHTATMISAGCDEGLPVCLGGDGRKAEGRR